jgi:hypothetical protein
VSRCYRVVGQESPAIAGLVRELATRGFLVGSEEQIVDLTLVSAPTLEGARSRLRDLSDSVRRRTVILDLPDVLDIMQGLDEDKLPHLLETYQPLGVLRVSSGPDQDPRRFGFIGSKERAEEMGTGVGKRYSSGSYGTWFQLVPEEPADFILRLLAKLDSSAVGCGVNHDQS